MTSAALRMAMISVHSSPFGPLGTQDTGGMSVYIRELSRELGRLGHRVDIFTAAGGEATGSPLPPRLHPNVRLVRLPLGNGSPAPKAELPAHLNTFAQAIEGFRARTGADYDLLHSHYWLSACVGEELRTIWNLPHIITFHTLGAVKDEVLGSGADPPCRMAAERDLSAACDRIVVTSRREQRNLVRLYGARPERIRIVPCGVDPVLFRPLDRREARRRIGAAGDERILLYVGRFAPEKGLERLLRTVPRLAHIRNLRLIVIGGESGPEIERMRDCARSSGVGDRVEFTGRVDHAALPVFYNAADLLVVPSAYESFGMVGLEALACGTPLAATRVGAMDELIVPGRGGCLAEGFEPDGLARAIEAALALPHAANDLEREEIRRTVLRYEWPRAAREILAVYRSVLPCGNAPRAALAADAERARGGMM